MTDSRHANSEEVCHPSLRQPEGLAFKHYFHADRSVRREIGVPIEISSYGESSYKLVPSSPLSAGEYAITLEQSPQAVNRRIFTFGID
jgi:hypothetical protein